jgi:hypothetical protein
MSRRSLSRERGARDRSEDGVGREFIRGEYDQSRIGEREGFSFGQGQG